MGRILLEFTKNIREKKDLIHYLGVVVTFAFYLFIYWINDLISL